MALAELGTPERFITLTCQFGRFGSPEAAARELSAAWRIIAKRLRRKYPQQRLEYLCIFEATKNGWPHLHILQRGPYISQRWLSGVLDDLIGSPICDIRRVKNPRAAARYVAKYIGKAPHRFGTIKRYWSSGAWVVVEKASKPVSTFGDGRWRVTPDSVEGLYSLWCRENKAPTQVDDWCVYFGTPPPWLSEHERAPPGGPGQQAVARGEGRRA